MRQVLIVVKYKLVYWYVADELYSARERATVCRRHLPKILCFTSTSTPRRDAPRKIGWVCAARFQLRPYAPSWRQWTGEENL